MSKILIVDDEKDMRWAMEKTLEIRGHTAISVTRGEEAIEKLKANNLDLIILDMQLPGMDGVQVLQELRKINRTVPVVFVTGYGSPETAAKVIKLGANDYLAKPFHNKTLMEVVDRNLNQATGETDKLEIPQLSPSLARKLNLKSPENLNVPEPSPIPKPAESQSKPEPIVVYLNPLAIFLLLSSFILFSALFFFRNELIDYYQNGKVWDYPLTYSHPSALALDGEKLWSIDWFEKVLYEHRIVQGQLTTSQMFKFKEYRPTGIAKTSKTSMGFYICDPWKKKIDWIQLESEENLQTVASYNSPGPNPSGLCYDDSFLWSCDLDTGKIYKHILDDKLSVIAEFSLNIKNPVALAVYKNHLWVLAGEGGLLTKFDTSEGLKMMESFSLSSRVSGRIVSFAVRKNEFFVLTENPAKLHHLKHLF